MTWDRPGCVWDGDGGGLGLTGVGRTGGVDDMMRRCRSLISSSAVSVYLGADLTTLSATWRFILERGFSCRRMRRIRRGEGLLIVFCEPNG